MMWGYSHLVNVVVACWYRFVDGLRGKNCGFFGKKHVKSVL